MEVKKAIEDRRSVRKYQEKEVSDSLVAELLEAARLAPSAWNAQPARFVIIKAKEIKEKLSKEKVFKHDFVCLAPVIIVCCADPEVFPKEKLQAPYSNYAELAGEAGAVRDVSIAAQNLVLRATELGLGSCYVGLIDREKTKEILGIPKNYVLPFVLPIGYPAENPKATPRKKREDLIVRGKM